VEQFAKLFGCSCVYFMIAPRAQASLGCVSSFVGTILGAELPISTASHQACVSVNSFPQSAKLDSFDFDHFESYVSALSHSRLL
jgi:hypothetical protein